MNISSNQQKILVIQIRDMCFYLIKKIRKKLAPVVIEYLKKIYDEEVNNEGNLLNFSWLCYKQAIDQLN